MPPRGVIIAGVLFAAAIAYYFYAESGRPKPGEPVASPTPLCCTGCGHAWMATIGRLPGNCPKCDQKNGYRALKCGSCDRIFGYTDYGSLEAIARCPFCGGGYIVDVDPEMFPVSGS